jgi:glutaredoxin-like YruB-family protein
MERRCKMEAPKKVVVYSTPTCPHCKRAKQFLEERGVPFQAVDVAADKAGRAEMIEKSGQMSVPVIEIDGVVSVGFDEARLKEQLGL